MLKCILSSRRMDKIPTTTTAQFEMLNVGDMIIIIIIIIIIDDGGGGSQFNHYHHHHILDIEVVNQSIW